VGHRLEAVHVGPAIGGKPDRLIVLCHGIHADAGQLRHLVDAWCAELPTAAFSLINAPLRRRHHWLALFQRKRREWFSIHDPSPAAYETGVRDAAELLNDFIDAELERLALPPDAYALVGYSQGAMVVLFAGLRRAIAPRAIVAIAGALIAPDKLAGEIRNTAPVLLLHGADDRVVLPTRSQSAAALLEEAGVPVETFFRPGLAHEIDDVEIREGGLFLRRGFDARNI
jgi:phospholipase/carboxylesterase